MKPRVRQVIVVEGRYDKNTLSQVVDAVIVETGGFSVFHDREKLAYLRRLAAARGVILMTDPDGAGFVIRNHLKGVLPPEQILQAYVPDVYGKERRKRKGGKEGKLGVEGMPPAVLLEALRRCGATWEGEEAPAAPLRLTKADLLEKGLIGPDSAARRQALSASEAAPRRSSQVFSAFSVAAFRSSYSSHSRYFSFLSSRASAIASVPVPYFASRRWIRSRRCSI